ncbi:hypothetical protein G7046_g1973 [Stylonectria norvegica]|nr:hypothetical protein G7046_g1973 [Stylonectria norvegica]
MEGYSTQPHERTRPPHPRTASRSSNSTSNTRTTSQSANSSTSQIAQSPQQANVHTSHRYHHATCARPTSSPRTPRATPRLSREASIESARQTAVSSFLQEKLQKERKAEIDKVAALSRTNTDMSASVELGRVSQSHHSSPTKGGESDSRRPQSNGGSQGTKRKGLGVNEMEQVISNLHKQNFDLKLELFHRRERQSVMEDRIETLESDKLEIEEMNDKLVQEMEKRDKAVEEAVAMIIMLEAKIEQFAQERSMVRQIEAQGRYGYDLDLPYEHPTPEAQVPDIARLEDDVKALNRMPSFLSERSENTENLRNVYLGVKGSVLTLPHVAEGSGDTESPANDMGSPSLSILSESSFISVYGQKQHPADVDEPLSLDGADSLPERARVIMRPKTSLAKTSHPPSRTARSNSISHTHGFQSITQIIGHSSPLQQIERTYSQQKDDIQTEDRDSGGFSGRSAKPPSHKKTRDEKREALRRVLTDAPGGVRLHDHALPPTPDTISTTTLRRFQNSNDTLFKQHGVSSQRSHGALSDWSAPDENHQEPPSGALLQEPSPPTKPSNARDFNGNSCFENRALIPRPQSASETTVSHRRGNDWESDSDDSDSRSLESSLDIWMRESSQPNKGRISPDLFSFPTAASRGGWAADEAYGPSNAYGDNTSIGFDPAVMLDLFPAQQALFTSAAPPAPNRRSSLHAQTGSTPAPSAKRSNGRVNKSPSRRGRSSRGRRNSDDPQMRAAIKTPIQQSLPAQPSSEQAKKNHYPPIAGQQAVRNGLTKLFRRSLGGSSSTPSEVGTPIVAETTTFPDAPKNAGMGVPSWVNRNNAIEDDRESATPPPIMRLPRQGRGVPFEIDVPATPVMDEIPPTPTTAIAVADLVPEHQGSSPRVVSATGTRRKWLPGFGRAASLKNRAG